MPYNIYKINKSTHSKYNCLSFEGLEEAVWEFNRLAILNKNSKNTVVCLTALNDNSKKITEKKNKKQAKKNRCVAKILYRVVWTNISDVREPSYCYTLYSNLDEAVCFFGKLTTKYKNNPDALICLCDAFDEDYSQIRETEQK